MLTINNLSFSYGKHQVLHNLSLEGVKKGEVIALIGPNATGKSTFFRCLSGLLEVPQESIFFKNEDIAHQSLGTLSKSICFLPQSFSCQAALTVFDIVLLAKKNTEGWRVSDEDIKIVEKSLQRLNISHLSDTFVGDLSGGQQQAVSICQALIRSPEMFLLDEPTSALDLRHQLDILTTVRDITSERNIITMVALHDLNLAARFADKVLLMKHGRILDFGDTEQVLSSPLVGNTYDVNIELGRTSSGYLSVAASI